MKSRSKFWITWLPIVVVQGYLWVTFILFWTSSFVQEINNPWQLSIFVFFAFGSLYLGYALYQYFHRNKKVPVQPLFQMEGKANLIIFIAAVHLLVYSLALLYEFDRLSLSGIINGIINPGAEYARKLEIYDLQATESRSNSLIKLITISYFLYYAGFTGFILFWNDLNRKIRILYMIAILSYCACYIAVGTNKGLGDILIFLGIGLMVRFGARELYSGTPQAAKYRMPSKFWVVGLCSLFLVYFTSNQLSRGEHFGGTRNIVRSAQNSLWANYFGPETSIVLNLAVNYSSSGYAGLAYSLRQNYEFSYGFGLFPGFHSYARQYWGVPDMWPRTYLARSELNTGWPGRMYWSTAFPWWASDLTFPGAVGLMGLLGWLFAWAWRSALMGKNLIGIAAFGMLCEELLYLNANNQVLMSRTGTWALATVIFLGLIQSLRPTRSLPSALPKF